MGITLVAATAVALNWVGVSIYTTKHNEDLFQHYFRSESECWRSKLLLGEDLGDRICIPVPELPQEFFDNQVERCISNQTRYYWTNVEAHSQACRDAAR